MSLWWIWINTASVQLALFVLIVAVLHFLLRKRSARLRYGLWCLVLLKAVTPPIWFWNADVSPILWSVGTSPASWRVGASPAQKPKPMAQIGANISPNQDREHSSRLVLFRAGEAPTLRNELALLQTELAQPDYPPYVPTLLAIWSGGVVVFFTVRLTRFVHAVVILRQARELKTGPIRDVYQKLAGKLKLKTTPRLLLAEGVNVPFLFGLLRPKIVLPAMLPEEITPRELDNVLLHELVHYRRRDLWVNWFEFPIQGIFWFHPLLLWAIFMLRHLREAACDESVLATGATGAEEYGKSLLNTLWAVRGRTAHTLGFLGIFERNTLIQNRLENIMQQQNRTKKAGLSGLILVLVAVGVIPFAFAQEDAAKTAAEKAKRKAEIRQQIAELQKELAGLEPTVKPHVAISYCLVDLGDSEKNWEKVSNHIAQSYPDATVELQRDNNGLLVIADEPTHNKISEMLELIRTFVPEPQLGYVGGPPQQEVAKDGVSALPSTYQQKNQVDAWPCLRIIPVVNMQAEQLSKTLLGLLPEFNGNTDPSMRMTVDHHSNSLLIMCGTIELTDAVEALVLKLDQPKKDKNENQLNRLATAYALSHIPAKDALEHLSQTAEKDVQITYDDETNSLFVVAPERLHEEIHAKILQLDQAPEKPKLDTEIERSLKRKVEFAEKIYETVKVQVEIGARQGTALNEAQARYNKFRALEDFQRWHYERANDLQEKAEWEQKLRETLESEQVAAQDWADAAMNHYQAGSAELKDVLTTQTELEDVKIRVLKFDDK